MKRLFALLALLLFCTGAARAADAPAATPAPLAGTVLEVRDVASYTYLRLKTKTGESWAAIPRTAVAKGAAVVIENPMLMHNFHSTTLGTTFATITFGTLAGSPAGMPAAHEATSAARNTAAVADAKVAKATGANARTVAEIINGRAALKDKPVLVRGRVVKVTPQVLGRNWVHLRDGSGSAADGSNDLLVTTKDSAAVGDVVLAGGTVHTDRDLGSGYAYKVLVEDATLKK